MAVQQEIDALLGRLQRLDEQVRQGEESLVTLVRRRKRLADSWWRRRLFLRRIDEFDEEIQQRSADLQWIRQHRADMSILYESTLTKLVWARTFDFGQAFGECTFAFAAAHLQRTIERTLHLLDEVLVEAWPTLVRRPDAWVGLADFLVDIGGAISTLRELRKPDEER